MTRIDVAIAVVCRNRQVLICRRRPETHLGGYWEFPGGKQQPGESIQDCLGRELREELDIAAEPVAALPIIEHDYPDVHVRLHPFRCAHTCGEPKPIGCAEVIWVDPIKLRDYPFPPANRDLIEQVIAALSPGSLPPQA